jgi:hypothetical protein
VGRVSISFGEEGKGEEERRTLLHHRRVAIDLAHLFDNTRKHALDLGERCRVALSRLERLPRLEKDDTLGGKKRLSAHTGEMEEGTRTHLLLEPLLLEIRVTPLESLPRPLQPILLRRLNRDLIDLDRLLLDALLLVLLVVVLAGERRRLRQADVRLELGERNPDLDMAGTAKKALVELASAIVFLLIVLEVDPGLPNQLRHVHRGLVDRKLVDGADAVVILKERLKFGELDPGRSVRRVVL